MSVILTEQNRVYVWVVDTFGKEAADNAPERALRTVEEVVELAQALNVDAATLHKLIDYVYSRPVGEVGREIAGSLLTLLSTASALGIDADKEFEKELERVWRPEVVARCRRRQIEKREVLKGDV